MPIFKDYLDWRGDVPFSVSPVNDADNYLFSVINTLDFSGIVPEGGGYVPLFEAIEAYFSGGGALELGVSASKSIVGTVRRLPEARRYEGILLTGCRHVLTGEEQFGALTLRLPDGRHYVSYRGTDDTITGWREDCMLSVLDEVPAQKSAADYLSWCARTYPGELVVGGHSKGGNLALYAAAAAEKTVQERIAAVYNFDGPGFEKDFFRSGGYEGIAARVHSILSENAMVGTLFFMGSELTVVKTRAFGILAHDGLNWEVNARGFVPAKGLSPAARAFNEAMDNVFSSMGREERREFISALFDTLESTGAVTLTDLTEQSIRRVIATGHDLSGREEVRRMLREVLENLARCYVSEKAAEIRLPKLRRLPLPTMKRKK